MLKNTGFFEDKCLFFIKDAETLDLIDSEIALVDKFLSFVSGN